MGYFLRKPPQARPSKKGPWKNAGDPTRPTCNDIRGMLVRAKEICYYIKWVRSGRPKADEKRAERMLQRWGKDVLCACDVCDIYADATLAALKWVCGESNEL
jgi:hypothetical protein